MIEFSIDSQVAEIKEAYNVNGQSFERTKDEWPDELAPQFSKVMLKFMTQAGQLSMKILNVLAVAMGFKVMCCSQSEVYLFRFASFVVILSITCQSALR